MARAAAKSSRRLPKQARARQTIGVVLEAAAQVLQREGYTGATTNRIAKRAGVSVGTIYQYFADKQQIFDALIRREIAGLFAVLEGVALDPSEPLAEGLSRLLHLLVRARPDAPPHSPPGGRLFRTLRALPRSRDCSTPSRRW